MADARPEYRLLGGLAVLLLGVVVLVAVDLLGDLRVGSTALHVVVEGSVALLGGVGLVLLLRHLWRVRRQARAARGEAEALRARLRSTEAEARRWRDEARDLLRGLGEAIDGQFDRWGLTPAEREVALLLLKGLTHKEIAQVRGVGEATARQQAQAVYRKAGVLGRHDLAAFFLEDLLLPSTGGETAEGGGVASREGGFTAGE
jgi:DNA-binding CsgD family transcriptional regulator